MTQLRQDAAETASNEEPQLRSALQDGFFALLRLPPRAEQDFRQHSRRRAANLLRQSIYGLVVLYLLVVVPIFLFNDDTTIPLWIGFGMLPIGAVLTGMWITTRLPQLDTVVETTLSISLFCCLLGTLYCSMLLEGKYFGQMAAYETIYILIVAFSILQLPPHLALGSSVAAFAIALLLALGWGLRPYWLDVMLYFGIPLLICTVNGYVLELSERRNFVQNLILERESRHLATLREQAERETRKQQRHTDYLALISGNLSLEELFTRTLRFLVEHTGAQVAAAYHLSGKQLQRVCSWAGDADALGGRQDVALQDTLMGPALQSRRIMRLENLRQDYLPVRLGMGLLPSTSLLIVPVFQADNGLAVIELGKITAFSNDDSAEAEAIITHLAYAVLAANAREHRLASA